MAKRRLIREKYSWSRALAIVVVGLVLGVVLVWQIIQPLRPLVAQRYVTRGDSYLISQEFSEAQGQYREALKFEPSDTTATEHLALATKGPANPALLKNFYTQNNVLSQLNRLSTAQASFSNPKLALEAGAGLYNAQDYAYAQYPLQTAVSMDPQYAEAWDWLAKDYGKLAKIDSDYTSKQKAAETTRDSLTTQYLGQ